MAKAVSTNLQNKVSGAIVSTSTQERSMKAQEVFDYFGGIRGAAEALKMSTQALYKWGEEVPKTRQAHVEVATKGKIKMDKPIYGLTDKTAGE
jgi:uncharacterized protein (DUF1015 family)